MTKVKKVGILSALFLAILVVFSCSVPAYAAPKQMTDGNIFDAEYYAANNPDVVAVYGTDENLLYQHYLLCGNAEGRKPYADTSNIQQINKPLIDYTYKLTLFDSCKWNGWTGQYVITEGGNFDEMRYALDYPDVAAVCGTSHEALWLHYSTIGIYEGRKAYVRANNDSISSRARVYLVDQYQSPACVQAYIDICDIAASICNTGMNDRQKILAVHDWMLENITYDYEEGHTDNFVDGAIYAGKTKCNGYAMTFDGFMAALGIDCHYVNGSVNGNFHGWNVVYVEGQWMELDVTFDDCYYDLYKSCHTAWTDEIKYTSFLAPRGTGALAGRTVYYED